MQSARSEVGGWGGVPTYATINQSVESIESSKRVMAEKRRSSVGVEKTATQHALGVWKWIWGGALHQEK